MTRLMSAPQLIQYNPLKDERGQVVRWCATATDIDDQKRTEERLRNEHIVLREEIDRSSMFGENRLRTFIV
jgi:formate hydrogenlyase transcriptional activator